ncbi:MAG: 3,4-dihydroxyphenylacetate 2,3-dioxygenase [archaeon]|nr:3,4-dihydroxyphenylacetate 2,3-dioxygenase [archaeon]
MNKARQAPNFDIVRTSHVEFLVTDLERSRKFYVDTLGFIETSSTKDRIYLRGVEDRFHHSLILTMGTIPAVAHIAYRVRNDTDLDLICDLFEKEMNLPVKWLEDGEDEEGLGPALRAQDPFGFPLEFFKSMDESEWLLQHFDRHRAARIMRIDHVNVLVPGVDPVSDWYTERLGFLCSEYTETNETNPKIWATWLRRKPTVHDIAIMTGVGPRLHHAGFSVAEKDNILDCADILASKGYVENIERGPGRHGISNAFFLYIRDPDGHRIELYTGDYLSSDPDWEPLKWKLDDQKRQTFWGAPAPEKWFNEASTLLSVFTGNTVPTSRPLHDPRKKKTDVTLAH